MAATTKRTRKIVSKKPKAAKAVKKDGKAKKPRKPNAWNLFVKKYAKDHPELAFNQVAAAARVHYKPMAVAKPHKVARKAVAQDGRKKRA